MTEKHTHEKYNNNLKYILLQIYTSIYVNTQLYLLLMQLYFALGDMFRLLKQPSSRQITM